MLSVIILTHNDEQLIADCLESIKKLADEIVVIDSESRDRTVEIVKHLGASVYVHPFTDFSTQRNFAFSKTSGDWVLYLDSDEFATKSFRTEIKSTIEEYAENDSVGGFYIQRRTFFLGKDWGSTDRVQRLFKRSHFKKWEGVVHETPLIRGEFLQITSPVYHYTHRTLKHMLEKTNEWSAYEAQLRFDAHHPKMNALRFLRVITTGFLQSYIKEKGYKNGTTGVIESVYQAFSLFITYAKLWELQQVREKK